MLIAFEIQHPEETWHRKI